MAARNYTNAAPPQALGGGGVDDNDTVLTVPSTSGYPTVPFTIGAERGGDFEEVMLCTAKAATTFTVTRGYDGTVPVAHAAGVSIEHCVAAIDYAEANAHVNDNTNDVHTQYLRKALLTTKGDLYVATAAGAITRLAVGADGQVLIAEAAQVAGIKWGTAFFPGSVMMYAGAAAPTGWLLCNGAVVAQATYAALFAIISTAFDTGGEGAGNFRLPDFRGRIPVGLGQGAGLTNRTMGQLFGAETVLLTANESGLRDHAHLISANNHSNNGTNDVEITQYAGGVVYQSSGVIGGAQPAITAHNNVQPSLVVNYIIKT